MPMVTIPHSVIVRAAVFFIFIFILLSLMFVLIAVINFANCCYGFYKLLLLALHIAAIDIIECYLGCKAKF